jgi:hypothetical protein
MTDWVTNLSDLEFEEAITTLQDGQVPFDSPEMLQRLAKTIISKLWETGEVSGESG